MKYLMIIFLLILLVGQVIAQPPPPPPTPGIDGGSDDGSPAEDTTDETIEDNETSETTTTEPTTPTVPVQNNEEIEKIQSEITTIKVRIDNNNDQIINVNSKISSLETEVNQPIEAKPTMPTTQLIFNVFILLSLAVLGYLTMKKPGAKKPSENTQLKQYVQNTMRQGYDVNSIKQQLRKTGYTEEEINKAF